MDKNTKNIIFAGIFMVSIISLYIAVAIFVFSESTMYVFNTLFALLLGITAGIVSLFIWRHYKYKQKNKQENTDKIDADEKAKEAGIFFGIAMAIFFALNTIMNPPNDPNLLAKAIVGGVVSGGIAGFIFYIFYKKLFAKKIYKYKTNN